MSVYPHLCTPVILCPQMFPWSGIARWVCTAPTLANTPDGPQADVQFILRSLVGERAFLLASLLTPVSSFLVIVAIGWVEMAAHCCFNLCVFE